MYASRCLRQLGTWETFLYNSLLLLSSPCHHFFVYQTSSLEATIWTKTEKEITAQRQPTGLQLPFCNKGASVRFVFRLTNPKTAISSSVPGLRSPSALLFMRHFLLCASDFLDCWRTPIGVGRAVFTLQEPGKMLQNADKDSSLTGFEKTALEKQIKTLELEHRFLRAGMESLQRIVKNFPNTGSAHKRRRRGYVSSTIEAKYVETVPNLLASVPSCNKYCSRETNTLSPFCKESLKWWTRPAALESEMGVRVSSTVTVAPYPGHTVVNKGKYYTPSSESLTEFAKDMVYAQLHNECGTEVCSGFFQVRVVQKGHHCWEHCSRQDLWMPIPWAQCKKDAMLQHATQHARVSVSVVLFFFAHSDEDKIARVWRGSASNIGAAILIW